MPWIYEQRTGIMTGPNGEEFQGYSGAPGFVNNPDAETRRGEGPIPRGHWTIDLRPYHGAVGPFSLRLAPDGHNAHGRTDFVIHGDRIGNPGTASEGCIILPRAAREAIQRSGESRLIVR